MARSGPTPEPAKPYAPWLLTPRVREKEMSRVELFERIRREYRDEGVSIRGLAERHRVHRRTVREAVRSAVPAPRKTPVRAASALGGHEATICRWLTEDLSAPRKQRHTARRVRQRLRGEHGAEVDFGEFHAEAGGVALRLWSFVMRLSHSGRGFAVAFAHQAQEAFFEGHVRAFAHFGGVPAGRIRYDGLKPAVTRILLGRDRVENERFIVLRSHYRVLAALAVADFRERTRRHAYLVTLAAAVALGYLALPPAASLWVIMNAGGYRGIYNSAYAGTATALAGGLWLMPGGFYVVRGAIARDQHTGVGQILAATPLRSVGYLAGKFWSNLLVLASMAGVLAVTALALQLARGESTAVDPGALLLPLVLLTLPVLAVTAAAAVPFETIPVLRAGLGNIAWFFVWMITAIAGQGVPRGGLGTVAASMRQAMAAQHLHPAEFSLGFTRRAGSSPRGWC